MRKPTRKELETANAQAHGVWQRHLQKHEVLEPIDLTSARSVWIAILFHGFQKHKGEWIHKDLVSDITRNLIPELGRDQQVRHLKRHGWNIESDGKGKHRIMDPYNPHPDFLNEQHRRESRIIASDFDELKKKTGNRCATCGAIEGEPDPRYGRDIVKLQQGHRDPSKPLDMSNVIPQCQYCNRSYRNDFTFDEKGRVRAVASEAPVKRATKAAQEKIYNYLKGLFDPNI